MNKKNIIFYIFTKCQSIFYWEKLLSYLDMGFIEHVALMDHKIY